jgi:hypothetical protein
MSPFVPLLTAHKYTQDQKYLKRRIYLLQTFLEQNPAPVDNNGGGSPAWETLSTAVRCYNLWFRAFFYLIETGSMSDHLLVDMLKSFWMHAEHLYDFKGHGNNWIVVESRVLATCGIMFPEFTESIKWREEGFKRLSEEFERQIFPDGVQYEFSPGYHHMAMNGFFEVWDLACRNGYTIPGISEKTMKSSFRYSTHAMRPDFTRLAINDSGAYNSKGRHPMLYKEGKALEDDSVVWAATCGKQGKEPKELSVCFPYSGLCFMRTGWHIRDLWSFFDGAPMGRAHIHKDCLGFEIYAYGTLFITDPGTVTYIQDSWTNYIRSTLSHNTVNIDGKDQNIAEEHSTEYATKRTLWYSCDDFDLAGGVFADGYEDIDEEIIHTRFLIFIKPRCWIVFDEITGTGTHRAESVYQFTPMRIAVDEQERVFRTMRVNLPNCEVFIRGDSPEMNIQCGETGPVRGWIGEARQGQSENIPAPRCSAVFKGELPLRWVSVIVPVQAGPVSGCRVTEIKGAKSLGVACDFPDGKLVQAGFVHTGSRVIGIKYNKKESNIPVKI